MPSITDWIAAGVSVICMIGSFVSFLIARKEKRQARESEEQAKAWAKNADKANIATRELYETILREIKRKKPLEERKELKENARNYICSNFIVHTQAVADHLGISKENAFELLLEMLRSDKSISCAGQCTKERIDEVIWSAR